VSGIALRTLAVPGLLNARDLGGLPTRDGRAVRPRLVLRTDSLIALPEEGRAALRALDVRTVVDLRDEGEIRAHGADVLPDGDTRLVHLELLGLHPGPPAADVDVTALVEASLPESPDDAARDVYRMLVRDDVPRAAWGRLLRLLADDDTGTALVHCAAGKDRTGVFAWLLLSVLGVEEDAIEADYLASNGAYADVLPRELEPLLAILGDLEKVRPFAIVDASYLAAARAEVEATAGGLAAYVRSGLGVDDPTVAALRDRLLV
jgi:protein-tyrosine phosphatase